jgi:hypothetical protein
LAVNSPSYNFDFDFDFDKTNRIHKIGLICFAKPVRTEDFYITHSLMELSPS